MSNKFKRNIYPLFDSLLILIYEKYFKDRHAFFLPDTGSKRGSAKNEAAKPRQAVRAGVEAAELEDAQQTKESKEEENSLHQDVAGLCQHCIVCHSAQTV